MLNRIKQPRTYLLAGALILGVLLTWGAFWSGSVSAQQPLTFESLGETLGLGNADLVETIINVVKVVLGLVTLAAVVYLIYGGYVWLTAGGNAQRVEKAKQIILQAVIGLVIILLAWAIVLFVTRTVGDVTSNGNTGTEPPCIGVDCPSENPKTFDLTGVTTCSARPDYDTNVPRSSAVALTFNHDVDVASVQAAVTDAVVTNPNLVIEKCNDGTACTDRTTLVKPLLNQGYSGSSPTGAPGAVKSEWVARDNTVTFYHTSFSTDEANPDNLYFEPNTVYRLTVPAKAAATALRDTTDPPGRTLQKCQKNATGSPIEGDSIPGENCREEGDTIVWTFTTGDDADGPPIAVRSTVPNSGYKTGSGVPDRNVSRTGVLGVDFTNAIDPASVTTDHFQVFKFTTAPDPITGQGGVTEASPLDPANFVIRVNGSGTGAWLQLKSGSLYDPFTWYKVVVKDFRNLCGTTQDPNPYEWVFQTNDTVPGVKFVYPKNGATNICPASEVFIKFATSMWDISSGSLTCEPGSSGSYVTTGSLSPNPGRGFVVIDEHDPANPNSTCTKYGFTPEDVLLTPSRAHTASVSTNLVIDRDGNTLNRTWSFTTGTPEACIQEPYIDRVSPGQGANGACISVIGRYFEKQLPGQTREADGQNAGDNLVLATEDQPEEIWADRNIVSTLTSGGLATNQTHQYKVTVNYPAPIGPLESNPADFYLQSDAGAAGNLPPCLLSVNPNSSQVNSQVDLRGKRFGSFGGNSQVKYSSADWSPNPGGWSEETISNVTVSGGLVGPGRVWVVRNDGAQSNELDFTVLPASTVNPGETVPGVVESTQCNLAENIIPSPNPKRNDTAACLNSQMTARFTIDMDIGTLNGSNIFLQKCDPACTTNIAATVAPAGLRGFTLTPSANLEPSTRYQVTITTNVTSAAAPAVALPRPYFWQFTTKADGSNCPVTGAAVTSSDAFGNAVTATPTRYVYRDFPYGANMTANATDDACRTLNPATLSFAWTSSNSGIATLTPNDTQTILAHDPPPAGAGSSDVRVQIESRTSAPVQISYDPVSCTTNSDCDTNAFGEACGAPGTSTCVENRCTPVVTGVEAGQCNANPAAQGPIGSWVTVKGCWFGSYDPGQSVVTFAGDKAGMVPNTAICGTAAGTWTNERIVREVPDRTTPDPADDAATGPIQITRFDGRTADGPTFTVNADPLTPGLCKINPNKGTTLTAVIASGARFGNDEPPKRPTDDQVNITHRASGSLKIMGTYANWSDTSVGTVIPGDAQSGSSDIRVVNDRCSSNSWPFNVTEPGVDSCTTRCSVDSDCGAGQGCGSNFCCGVRPAIVPPTSPVDGATNVCRNGQVDINFSLPIRAQAGAVTYTDGGNTVNGRQLVRTSTLSYQPGLLGANATQVVTLDATKIRSLAGVSANVAGTPLQFQTGADICKLDKIQVRTALGSVSHRFTSVGEVMEYRADGISNRNGGTVIVPVPGSYAWTWGWRSGNDGVATLAMNGGPADNPSSANVTARGNGTTIAEATATVTEDALGADEGRKVSGSGEVVVDVCNFPWTFTDASGNCDTGGTCNDFHFSLNYCRGQVDNSDLLPDFSYTGSNGALGSIEGQNATDTSRLKSIFFKESPTSRDAIGILIFDNPSLLAPYDWFKQRFPLDSGGSSTVIAGYPALRTGTTAYIGVTDLDGGTLRGRMFVIDFNSNNATPQTQNIYNQLLNKVTFNTNIPNLADRQQIVNDTKRVQDLASIKLGLQAYHEENDTYPPLTSGSYLIGLSTSRWPSWQQTLANQLGKALPTDPANAFTDPCRAGDTSFEQATCWSESKKQFECPANSHVYLYKSNGTTFTLGAHLEYTGPGNFQGGAGVSNLCAGIAGANCGCFNYSITP